MATLGLKATSPRLTSPWDTVCDSNLNTEVHRLKSTTKLNNEGDHGPAPFSLPHRVGVKIK